MFCEKRYLKKCEETDKDTNTNTNIYNHIIQIYTIPQTYKNIFLESGIVTQACNSTTLEAETVELPKVWGQPRLHSKFQSRPAKATERDPISSKQNKTKICFTHQLQ